MYHPCWALDPTTKKLERTLEQLGKDKHTYILDNSIILMLNLLRVIIIFFLVV